MSFKARKNEDRTARWYYGGLSSTAAVYFTHPLDLVKVQMQTQEKRKKMPLNQLIRKIYNKGGVLNFYHGVSASLLRQVTYSTARFGFYTTGKHYIRKDSFWQKVGLATSSGMIAGVFGVPSDLINVRMQNDAQLPKDKRRNYRGVFDGLRRVWLDEGPLKLFKGGTLAIMRGTAMTIGQLVFYDTFKQMILSRQLLNDGPRTHMISSISAAFIATMMTQPLDVLKTRKMNAKPGRFKTNMDVLIHTAKLGPAAFYRGFVPSFIRIGPGTVLTFLMFEQMRLYYGLLPEYDTKKQKPLSIL